MPKKKLVYIAHPVGGDIEGNIKRILKLCREIHLRDDNIVPFAPYVVSLQYLDDSTAAERTLGIAADKEYFRRRVMDEVWLCGDRISAGMKKEVEWAEEYGILVVDKTTIKG